MKKPKHQRPHLLEPVQSDTLPPLEITEKTEVCFDHEAWDRLRRCRDRTLELESPEKLLKIYPHSRQ